jgi:outer membrane protein
MDPSEHQRLRRLPATCRPWRTALLLAVLCPAGPANAQGGADTEPPAEPVPAAIPAQPAAPETLSKFEGAIGAIASYGPEIPGARRSGASLSPAFYFRYGRLTVSNGGGFVNRRSDDVLRGVGLDLVDKDRRRVSLTLRIDRGRKEAASPLLRGLGDVPSTLRARIAGTWLFDDGWRANASWSLDAFGRGGGNLGDIGISHERRWSPVTVVTASAGLTLAGDRYLQTYYGISAEQAQRSGYPEYRPRFGVRDVAASLGLRTELGPHWAALASVGVSRLLGPAAASPIVAKPLNFGASAGLAWRF